MIDRILDTFRSILPKIGFNCKHATRIFMLAGVLKAVGRLEVSSIREKYDEVEQYAGLCQMVLLLYF